MVPKDRLRGRKLRSILTDGGYGMMMNRTGFDLGRRVGAAALAALIVVGSLSGPVVPKVCHMNRSPSSRACHSCTTQSDAATGASLSAASCCRFDAPRDTPSTPVLTVSAQRLATGGDVPILLPRNSSDSRETATALVVCLAASVPIDNTHTTSVLRL